MKETLQQWLLQAGLDAPVAQPALWTLASLWSFLLPQSLIALACLSTAPAFWYMAWKRRDFRSRRLLVLFGCFATGVGLSFLIDIAGAAASLLNVWIGIGTALIAAVCGVAVWPAARELAQQPGRDELQAAYRALIHKHRQLMASEARYRLLLETAGEGVWLIDTDGRISFANRAMAQMLGCTSLEGRSLFDFVFPEELAVARERLQARIAGDTSQREFRWRRADGAVVHSLVSMSVMKDAVGTIGGLMGVITDISDRVAVDSELNSLNLELGRRVEERTRALEESNRDLAREIVVREYVQAELAASNERLNHYVHELQKHTGDIARLNRVADALHGSDTHADLVAALSVYCSEALECDGGVLYEWRDGQLEVLEEAWGSLSGQGPVFLVGARTALEQNQPVPPAPAGLSLELAAADLSVATNLSVPLRLREKPIGALVLARQGSFWSGDPVTDRRQEQILMALADHVAQAITNLNLVERLREQSFSDALTGLYNRRYFYEQIGREISMWRRTHQSFALIMLDIDHFKSFNDRYGHHVGDEVLVQVAELLNRHTRRSDSACRLGGEEFVVLMPGAGATLALERAEMIRMAVKALSIDGVAVGESVSVSAGVAIYPDHGDESRGLLRAADRALYQSKHEGRDRTSLAG